MAENNDADFVFESGSPLHRSCIHWKIRHFSAYISEFLAHPEGDERALHSPVYLTNSGKEWGLTIYLTESLGIEFYINLESLKEDDITSSSMCIHTELSVIVDGQKHETQQETITSISMGMLHCVWKMKMKDLKKFMKNICKDDTLCIKFEIEEWNKDTITVMTSHNNDIVKCLPISNTIINFLTDQTLTDVTVQCQGKKFKAHKVILAAASPVFGAMFKEGTKEHEDNNVNIQDINSEVFEVFLHYLYSGDVDQLGEMYLDLFTAADKYDVQPLRNICIQHMANNITMDNALEVLALAERHSIESTKSSALHFIKLNFTEVVKTDSWTSLLVNNPGDAKRLRDGGSQSEESAGKRKK